MPNKIIVPEVFADAVNAAMGVMLRAANVATDYTDMMDEITSYGGKVHFPVIDRINDAVVIEKGVALVPNEVSMSDAEAEIKQVGESIRIYDKDNIQVKGHLKDHLAKQLGESLAKAVDADLVNSIRTEAVYKDATLEDLTQDDIENAFDVFGDNIDNDTFAGILINSKLRKKFMKMDAFTDGTKTNAVYGNGVAMGGCIGLWNGTIPVYVTNNGTYNDGKAMLAIVKKNALGVIWQRVPSVEEGRDVNLRCTHIAADELYATKLVHTDGVSVLEITA